MFSNYAHQKVTKPPVLADHTFHAFMAIDIVNFASYYMSIRVFENRSENCHKTTRLLAFDFADPVSV